MAQRSSASTAAIVEHRESTSLHVAHAFDYNALAHDYFIQLTCYSCIIVSGSLIIKLNVQLKTQWLQFLPLSMAHSHILSSILLSFALRVGGHPRLLPLLIALPSDPWLVTGSSGWSRPRRKSSDVEHLILHHMFLKPSHHYTRQKIIITFLGVQRCCFES